MDKQRHQVIPRTMCLVFDQSGRLLLIKFSKDKGKMAGFYDPPGGHIEHGESIVGNAVREIREETGLEVTDTKLRGVIHATNFFGKNIMLFVTSSLAATTDAVGSKEGNPEWVSLGELDELKIFEDIKHVIELVGDSNDSSVFTATSEFDDQGRLIKWEIDDIHATINS